MIKARVLKDGVIGAIKTGQLFIFDPAQSTIPPMDTGATVEQTRLEECDVVFDKTLEHVKLKGHDSLVRTRLSAVNVQHHFNLTDEEVYGLVEEEDDENSEG